MGKYKRKYSSFFEPAESGTLSDITTETAINSSLEPIKDNKQNDVDSAYESDDGTLYKPGAIGDFKVVDMSTLLNKPIPKTNCVYVRKFDALNVECRFYNRYKEFIRVLIPITMILKPEEQASFDGKNITRDFFGNHKKEILQYLVKENKIRKGSIGQGSYSNARSFESKPDHFGNKRTRIVLDSITRNFDEIDENDYRTKEAFYKIFYGDQNQKPFLFLNNKQSSTYRLVVPKAQGLSYERILYKNSLQQVQLFLSTIRAIKKLHDKGYIYLDLKSDNIFYQPPQNSEDPFDVGFSSLIDGGLMTRVDFYLGPVFLCEHANQVSNNRNQFKHIAPECWSTTPIKASPSMDVYSIARLVCLCCEKVNLSLLKTLLRQCLLADANARPSLNTLEHELTNWLQEDKQEYVFVTKKC